MPFYEYQCASCGHALEAMQKVTDAPLKKCPHCGKAQLQKLMSAPVFRLKGGGWYETDFKSDQDSKRNLADRPEPDAAKETKETKEKAESGSKEPVASESSAKPDKGAEKSSDKPAAETAKKAPPAATSPGLRRSAGTGSKSSGRKPAKRPARPAAKRSAKKPARRR
jgi:putative FmdB family regulatory protein